MADLSYILGAAMSAIDIRRAPFELADAIVVLGAPAHGGSLTDVGRERVEAGVELYERGAAPILCMTGGSNEAELMASYALECGVPPRAIRVEPDAQNTEQSAYYCGDLLRAEDCRKVWVVSQPFHLRRTLFWFRRAGLEALPWHHEESLQYAQPKRAARWLSREYAAWGLLAARRLVRAVRPNQKSYLHQRPR